MNTFDMFSSTPTCKRTGLRGVCDPVHGDCSLGLFTNCHASLELASSFQLERLQAVLAARASWGMYCNGIRGCTVLLKRDAHHMLRDVSQCATACEDDDFAHGRSTIDIEKL
jgi:hypothetical protein